MKTKKVKIGDIKLNPKNPRIIRDEKFKKLVASIKEFPKMMQIRPIVVNKEMEILGGNMRYKACQEVGLKHLLVIDAEYNKSWQTMNQIRKKKVYYESKNQNDGND